MSCSSFVARASVVAVVVCAIFAVAPASVEAQRRGGRSATGRLIVEGPRFEGAEVFVDAESVGRLPLEPIEIERGEHTVRVVQPGFTEFTEVVFVQRGREVTVNVDMLPVSMVLHVETEPEGAQVFVDGRFSGETPVDLDLVEGEHSIRIARAGYREVIREVQARAGERDAIELTLEELPRDERRVIVVPPENPEWYERPLTWVFIGAGAVAVALGVVLIVVLTADEPTQADQFCSGGTAECIRFRF